MLRISIRILEVLFAVGAIGSVLVIVLTFVEDLLDIWRDDEQNGQTGVDTAA